jgi:hypothetical protein
VHGFGFAFAFRDALQLAAATRSPRCCRSTSAWSAKSSFCRFSSPPFGLLFTRVVTERTGIIVVSVLAGHGVALDGRSGCRLQLLAWPLISPPRPRRRWLLILTIAGGGCSSSQACCKERMRVTSGRKSIVDTR